MLIQIHDPNDLNTRVNIGIIHQQGRLELQVGRPGSPELRVTQHATWADAGEAAVQAITAAARALLELER